MKVAERFEARRGSWQELETLCVKMETQWRRRPKAAAVARFASLYRSACADLALADAYNLPPSAIHYLHDLVARAHNQLYRTRTFQLGAWRRTMFVDVPRQLFSDIYLRLAMLLFWGVFLLGVALAWRNPGFAYQVAGKEYVDSTDDSFSVDFSNLSADVNAFASGYYVWHNPTIGLRCFAYGLLLGVGGLLETAMNAAVIGTLFGFMIDSPNNGHFFQFVTAHAPFELTAIVLMAAAGMRLGFSVIDTGGRSRADSLRRAAGKIVPVASAGVVFFLFAAVIEAFVSPSVLPYPVKAAVAIVSAMMIFCYIVVLGYPREVGYPGETVAGRRAGGALADAR